MKYVKEVTIILLSLVIYLFANILNPELKTNQYLVKEIDINKEVSDFVTIDLNYYNGTIVRSNVIVRIYKQSLKLDIPTVIYTVPSGSEIPIDKGDILNVGDILYLHEDIPYTAESKLRLVSVEKHGDTKLVFEDLGNTNLFFTHFFNANFNLEGCRFYYMNHQNIKIEVLPKEVIYNLTSGSYTFVLSDFYFDPFVLNGDEVIISMSIETNTNYLYIEKDYLMYDNKANRYFVKKYLFSDKLGDGYRIVYVDVVNVYDEFILIEGDLSVNNILLIDK